MGSIDPSTRCMYAIDIGNELRVRRGYFWMNCNSASMQKHHARMRAHACTPRYYELLGLRKVDMPGENEIKKAYHKMALKCHPDRAPPEKVQTLILFPEPPKCNPLVLRP